MQHYTAISLELLLIVSAICDVSGSVVDQRDELPHARKDNHSRRLVRRGLGCCFGKTHPESPAKSRAEMVPLSPTSERSTHPHPTVHIPQSRPESPPRENFADTFARVNKNRAVAQSAASSRLTSIYKPSGSLRKATREADGGANRKQISFAESLPKRYTPSSSSSKSPPRGPGSTGNGSEMEQHADTLRKRLEDHVAKSETGSQRRTKSTGTSSKSSAREKIRPSRSDHRENSNAHTRRQSFSGGSDRSPRLSDTPHPKKAQMTPSSPEPSSARRPQPRSPSPPSTRARVTEGTSSSSRRPETQKDPPSIRIPSPARSRNSGSDSSLSSLNYPIQEPLQKAQKTRLTPGRASNPAASKKKAIKPTPHQSPNSPPISQSRGPPAERTSRVPNQKSKTRSGEQRLIRRSMIPLRHMLYKRATGNAPIKMVTMSQALASKNKSDQKIAKDEVDRASREARKSRASPLPPVVPDQTNRGDRSRRGNEGSSRRSPIIDRGSSPPTLQQNHDELHRDHLAAGRSHSKQKKTDQQLSIAPQHERGSKVTDKGTVSRNGHPGSSSRGNEAGPSRRRDESQMVVHPNPRDRSPRPSSDFSARENHRSMTAPGQIPKFSPNGSQSGSNRDKDYGRRSRSLPYRASSPPKTTPLTKKLLGEHNRQQPGNVRRGLPLVEVPHDTDIGAVARGRVAAPMREASRAHARGPPPSTASSGDRSRDSRKAITPAQKSYRRTSFSSSHVGGWEAGMPGHVPSALTIESIEKNPRPERGGIPAFHLQTARRGLRGPDDRESNGAPARPGPAAGAGPSGLAARGSGPAGNGQAVAAPSRAANTLSRLWPKRSSERDPNAAQGVAPAGAAAGTAAAGRPPQPAAGTQAQEINRAHSLPPLASNARPPPSQPRSGRPASDPTGHGHHDPAQGQPAKRSGTTATLNCLKDCFGKPSASQ